ncbi:MAG: FAD binding domain-containing protein [Linnemannia gamsii]|nr:MAG: FAD binding domain-containing protein [Linnemannia gamsii]
MPQSTTPSTSSPQQVPVLIVGAGPVGLYEALLLTQLGIPVRIIERTQCISPNSRALGLHARTMEILRFTGTVDPFFEMGKPLTKVHYYSNARLVGAMPVIQASEHSQFSTGWFLEQAKTSEIFLTKLREFGVEVEYGWELLDTKVVEAGQGREEEEYVETIIRRALEGGHVVKGEDQVLGEVESRPEQKDKKYETQVVRSKYLVACDGGRSTVRHKVNIAFPGRSLPHKTLMWDGHCECDIPMTGLAAVRGPNGKTLFIFPMNDGMVRIGVEDCDLAPGEDFEQTLRELSVEHFEAVVAETASPAKFKVKSTTWLTCFKTNERRAENFVYKNRIFLAGDAAHIHSPSGGQGLNTGLHDAHNLAWKLGFVLNGVANPEFLLPTYEERGAMADRAIRVSSALMERNRANGFVANTRNWLVFAIAPLIAKFFGSFFFTQEVAMLDVKYSANDLNRPHKTQPAPTDDDLKVGVRAKDGVLLAVDSSITTQEKDRQTTLRLHDLCTGIARFHILVFASDHLTTTSGTEDIQTFLDRHVAQWRAKWTYKSTLVDGYTDKDLFKVHIIAGSTPPTSNVTVLELSKRQVGDGKVYVDSDGQTHKRYGFAPVKAAGGIVVIRPDAHVGFRVHGVHEQAWKDVDEYFSTVLASQSE